MTATVCRAGFGAFAADAADADYGVLAIGAGFAFKAEGVFEVKGDDGVAREFQQEETERAYGDGVGGLLLFRFAHFRVALLDFGERGGFEFVDQVVGFDAEAFAAADLDERQLGFFGSEFVAQFGGAARSEHHEGVGQMDGVLGGFGVAEAAQGFRDHILHVRLARVDDVVNRRWRVRRNAGRWDRF